MAKQLLRACVPTLPAWHPHLGTLLMTVGNASLQLALRLEASAQRAATTTDEQQQEQQPPQPPPPERPPPPPPDPEVTSLLEDAARFFERAHELWLVSFGPAQPAPRRAMQMKAAVRRRLKARRAVEPIAEVEVA